MTDREQVANLIRALGSDPDSCADVIIKYLSGAKRIADSKRKRESRANTRNHSPASCDIQRDNQCDIGCDNACDNPSPPASPLSPGFSPPTPPSLPAPSLPSDPPAPERDPGFSAGKRTELTPAADAFWAELPPKPRNRSTRREFEKAWRKERCEAIASEIMLALADWKKAVDWTRDGGEYIPAAHRLIARRFWESRPQVQASRNGQAPRRPSWRDDDRPILADLSLKFDPEAVS